MVIEGADLQSIEVGIMDGHILEVSVHNNFEVHIEDIVGNIEGS